MKISVLTVVFNKPEFIQYQYLLLKKYLKNEFDFFVYNNSNDPKLKEEIKQVCEINSIKYYEVPQEIQSPNTPSHRAGISLDYSIKHNIQNYNTENLIVLDSDMFIIDYFDFEKEVDSDFKGIKQKRNHVYYYTNQLFFAKIKNLQKFDKAIKFPPGNIDGVNTDCGGYLYYYFNGNKNIIHKDLNQMINSQTLTSEDIEKSEIFASDENLKKYFLKETEMFQDKKNFSEIYQSKFLHFRAGSNWINIEQEKNQSRQENLFDLLSYLIKK